MRNQLYKSYLLALISFALLIVLNSCGRKNKRETWYLNQVFKDFCAFDTGSYWIYEDSLTGKLDSWFVISADVITETGKNVAQPMQVYEAKFGSSLITEKLLWSSRYYNRTGNYLFEAYDNQLIEWIDAFEIDTAVGTSIMYSNDKYYRVLNRYGNFQIEDSLYKNVIQISTGNVFYAEYITEAWWCSKIGRVKYIRKDNSVWELLRYKVKQKK